MLMRVLVAALIALVTATSLTVVTQYNGAQVPLQQSQEFTLSRESREPANAPYPAPCGHRLCDEAGRRPAEQLLAPADVPAGIR